VDFGEWTTTAAAGYVPTRLRWIDQVMISQNGGTDQSLGLFKNTQTAVTTELIPGFFYFNNATAGTYRFWAIGR
jgi:hypothetical protein